MYSMEEIVHDIGLPCSVSARNRVDVRNGTLKAAEQLRFSAGSVPAAMASKGVSETATTNAISTAGDLRMHLVCVQHEEVVIFRNPQTGTTYRHVISSSAAHGAGVNNIHVAMETKAILPARLNDVFAGIQDLLDAVGDYDVTAHPGCSIEQLVLRVEKDCGHGLCQGGLLSVSDLDTANPRVTASRPDGVASVIHTDAWPSIPVSLRKLSAGLRWISHHLNRSLTTQTGYERRDSRGVLEPVYGRLSIPCSVWLGGITARNRPHSLTVVEYTAGRNVLAVDAGSCISIPVTESQYDFDVLSTEHTSASILHEQLQAAAMDGVHVLGQGKFPSLPHLLQGGSPREMMQRRHGYQDNHGIPDHPGNGRARNGGIALARVDTARPSLEQVEDRYSACPTQATIPGTTPVGIRPGGVELPRPDPGPVRTDHSEPGQDSCSRERAWLRPTCSAPQLPAPRVPDTKRPVLADASRLRPKQQQRQDVQGPRQAINGGSSSAPASSRVSPAHPSSAVLPARPLPELPLPGGRASPKPTKLKDVHPRIIRSACSSPNLLSPTVSPPRSPRPLYSPQYHARRHEVRWSAENPLDIHPSQAGQGAADLQSAALKHGDNSHSPLCRSEGVPVVSVSHSRTRSNDDTLEDDTPPEDNHEMRRRVRSDVSAERIRRQPATKRAESVPESFGLDVDATSPSSPSPSPSPVHTPSGSRSGAPGVSREQQQLQAPTGRSHLRRAADNAKTAILALSRTISQPAHVVIHQSPEQQQQQQLEAIRQRRQDRSKSNSPSERHRVDISKFPMPVVHCNTTLDDFIIVEGSLDDSDDVSTTTPVLPLLALHNDQGVAFWRERCQFLEHELVTCQEIRDEKTAACSQLQAQLGMLKKNMNRMSASCNALNDIDSAPPRFGVDVCDLSVHQVCKLLHAYQLERYEFIFKTYKIDGSSFAALNHVTLEKQLGVKERTHRDMILKIAGCGLVEQI